METERDALTYLHANCGVSGHNPTYPSEAWWTGLYMRLEVGHLSSPGATRTYRTGVGLDCYMASPTDKHVALPLIAPGNPDGSALIARDSERGTAMQMPPLATHGVNHAGLELTQIWISGLT